MRTLRLLVIVLGLVFGPGLLPAHAAFAGRFVAVPDASTPDPATKSTAMFRIPNTSSACGTVFWSFGAWCAGDEVTAYFDLPNDPQTQHCEWYYAWLQSAEVEFRIVGTTCNGGYPVTTLPFDGQYNLYFVDPAVSTPACPVPEEDPVCTSVVETVPARTANSAVDPARTFTHAFDFGFYFCNLGWEAVPCFGAFRWVAFSVPESSLAACGQGGQSPCAWWYPGLRGRNGHIDQSPCAIPCTQYYRNVAVSGPGWVESQDAGLGRLTDFAHWLNVNLPYCGPVEVRETTWGKLKSLMHR